jgi:toxin YoeB
MDKAVHSKINKLLLETARTPFTGTGKPEALKHDLKGYWSRRINDEHRLVYRVEATFIKIIACKLHY